MALYPAGALAALLIVAAGSALALDAPAAHAGGEKDYGHDGEKDYGHDGEKDYGHDGEKDYGHDGEKDYGHDGEKDYGHDGEKDYGHDGEKDYGHDGEKDYGHDGDREHRDAPSRATMSEDGACGSSELPAGGACIPYKITSGEVTGAVATEGAAGMTELAVSIESPDDGGKLALAPIMKGCGPSDAPLILVDGEEWDDYMYHDGRLKVMFAAGTELVEVVGECVAPAFGADPGAMMAEEEPEAMMAEEEPEAMMAEEEPEAMAMMEPPAPVAEPAGSPGLPPPCPDCVGDGRAQADAAAASATTITVRTDAASYGHSSTVVVEGTVARIKYGMPVTLIVTSSTGNIVSLSQLPVDRSGGFSTSFSTDGPLWKYDGTYTLRVQYGAQASSNKATFDLVGGVQPAPVVPEPPADGPPACPAGSIAAGDDCVQYEITGGASVTGASVAGADGGFNVLTVAVDSAGEDGILTVMPMAPGCNEAGDPLVVVDGEEWDDYAFDGSELSVMFPAGAGEVEVIGTCVVPEFGAVAVLALAAAVVAAVALTARSRPGLLVPRP